MDEPPTRSKVTMNISGCEQKGGNHVSCAMFIRPETEV